VIKQVLNDFFIRILKCIKYLVSDD